MTSDPKKITVCGRRNHLSLTLLNESVETIHISTLPFKWLVEEILRRSPRVKTIEIPPCFENQLYRGARERLQQAGVNVVFGCRTTSDAKRTAKTWSTRWFWNKKHFLDTIDGEPKKRLETLLAMRWKPAEMMLKHFGIEQPRQTHKELSKEYGYKKASQGSAAIQAVLCYLNESFIAGTYLAPTINTIRRRVRAYEATLRVNTHHEQLATTFASLSSHGIVLAKNTPLKELANVQTLQQAKQNGRLDQLQTYWPDFYNVLMVRYGLHPDHQPCFKKIDEVATICGKRTRQRISQILISAFTKLRSHTNLEKKQRHAPVDHTLIAMKDEDSEAVERLNNAINRCWGTTGDVLKSRYLGWPRRVMLFVLHTRYAWSYEKIRKAIGAYKVTAIAALCRSVHKKINAGPPSSRVTITKKFRKKFDALLAQLTHR